MRLRISYQITVGGGVIEHDLSVEPRSVLITAALPPESYPGRAGVPHGAAMAPPFRVHIQQRGDAEDLGWLVLPTADFRLVLSDDQEGANSD